jgi:polyisoprenoid-binding protein YceI
MTWQIDPMHTQVEFSAKHFGMMTVRGHFTDVATSGNIDPANPAGSSVDVTINVASLTTNNAQRDNDLRSSYFLELDKYPTITFHSTRVEPTGPDTFALTGDLTVKGITKPITLQVQHYGEMNDPMMGHRVAYSAEGQINRKDFGMEFDMLADNRLVVSHEIKVYIEIEVMEQKQEQPAAAAAAASA